MDQFIQKKRTGSVLEQNNTPALAKAVFLFFAIYLLLSFLAVIKQLILVFVSAVIFTIAINPMVVLLCRKGLPRKAGATVVLILIFFLLLFISWLVIPRIILESRQLIKQLPALSGALTQTIDDFLKSNNISSDKFNIGSFLTTQALPAVTALIGGLLSYSLSVFYLFLLIVTFLSIIIYALPSPKPLLRIYLGLFPKNLRIKAARAYMEGARITVAWMRVNLILGTIEAVTSILFLSIIGIPAPFIWGAIFFISEFIPRIGLYIAMVPPALVALAIDPILALWVIIFYILVNEITEDLIAPFLRSSQTSIHPVFIILAVVGFGFAFGFWGALVALPIAGFIKGFYQQFYFNKHPFSPKTERELEKMLG